MLEALYIRDFAIVERLELNFTRGLTVLTGETGAGKSIIIDALDLALGARADSGVIRHGCARCEISAAFDLDAHHDAARWLAEHDLFDEAQCLVRRVIEVDKPSKGFINGRPVPIQMLRELGERLVDIHGQHEHQSLLKRDAQRQVVDDYAGLSTSLGELAEQYRRLKELEARRDALRQQGADQAARIELLRYQVQELKALDLERDELPGLEEEHRRLANANELLQGAQEVAGTLYDDDEAAVSRLLHQAQRRLEALAEYDPKLGELGSLLNEALIQVDEAANALHHYADNVELDPERLQWVDQRLAAAHDLARKHKVRPEELPALRVRLEQELDDLENVDLNLERLTRDIEAARGAYLKTARQVSAGRAGAAQQLNQAVSELMQSLGMPGGRFEARLSPLEDGQISAHGLERIDFLVSANPGQPLKPLNKVASGGELSRISLGLQVATSEVGRIPTLIFDEVDVGIGGGVAEIVGVKLRGLAARRQVLCITHLPQVAAQGHHHLQVRKHTHGGATVTHIAPLPPAERVNEIARMLGGVEITPQTLALASELLDRVPA